MKISHFLTTIALGALCVSLPACNSGGGGGGGKSGSNGDQGSTENPTTPGSTSQDYAPESLPKGTEMFWKGTDGIYYLHRFGEPGHTGGSIYKSATSLAGEYPVMSGNYIYTKTSATTATLTIDRAMKSSSYSTAQTGEIIKETFELTFESKTNAQFVRTGTVTYQNGSTASLYNVGIATFTFKY